MSYSYCLKQLGRPLGAVLLCLLLALAARAQTGTQRYTLKGRVSDAAGQGLPGTVIT